jgi:kynureninase
VTTPSLRQHFHLPPQPNGQPCLYFAGHSLGPQPREARAYVNEALDDWARLGVEGHLAARHPWLPYHEELTAATARLVGALPSEVVVMNTLTVNLHLLLVSFYRPTPKRYRIVIEAGAFPSDRYAVASQARFHGFDPAVAVVELAPRPGEGTLRTDDILAAIARDAGTVALVLLGSCQFLTGQAFDIAAISAQCRKLGIAVGFDLAHGAGNLALHLHDDGPDFAAWCNYKYLNAGPGGLGGVFVHERLHGDAEVPRLAGWWGHDKATRFQMPHAFQPIPGAEAWQLSNPPILQLAALRASMELFDGVGMAALRQRGDALTQRLQDALDDVGGGWLELLTPRDSRQRGSMLTLRVQGDAAKLVRWLHERGAVVDLRAPDVVRVTPAPLYVTEADIDALHALLGEYRSLHVA